MESITPLVFSVQDDPKQEGEKAIHAAIQKIVKAGPTETFNSVTIPLAGVQAIQYKDTAQAVEGQLDLLRPQGQHLDSGSGGQGQADHQAQGPEVSEL